MAERFQRRYGIHQAPSSIGEVEVHLQNAALAKSVSNGIVETMQGFQAQGQIRAKRQQKAVTREAQEAEKVYQHSTLSNAMVKLSEFEGGANNNPDNFFARADSFKKVVVQEAPQEYRQDIEMMLTREIAKTTSKLNVAYGKQQHSENVSSLKSDFDVYQQDAERLSRSGDIEGAQERYILALDVIDTLEGINAIDSQEAQERIQDLSREMDEQIVRRQMQITVEEQGLDAAYEWLDGIAKSVPETFTPDQFGSLVADMQKDLNRQTRRQLSANKQEQEALELDVSVDRGELLMLPGALADPYDKDDRQDLNNYFNSLPSQETIEAQKAQLIDFVSRSGIMPDRLKSNANAVMRKGTDAQVLLIADTLGVIAEVRPQALTDIRDETLAMSRNVIEGVQAGMSLEQSIELSRAYAYGLSQAEKGTIKLQSQHADIDTLLEKHINRVFDQGILYSQPDAPPALTGEFRMLFDRFMGMTHANIDQSSLLAFNAIRKTWGVTEIGGRRLMKYAPEVVYGIAGVDNDWIEDQFEQDNAEVKDPVLVIDPYTARQEQPSYLVLTPNNSGELVAVRDERNQIKRWYPDFTQSADYERVQERSAQAIQRARNLRTMQKRRKKTRQRGR